MQTRRALGGQVRAAVAEDGRHTIELRAIRPGVVDDYGSLWMPDCFDETLAQRMPVLCWSHDWSDPIGAAIDYTTGPDGPLVRFVFDDFDAVPRAKQAFAQTRTDLEGKPPTITDCSVGFSRLTRRDPTEQELEQYGPRLREVMLRATMDELSLVLAGAVPGAVVAGVRSGIRMANTDTPVSREGAAALMAQLATGEFTLTQALHALDALPVLEAGTADDDGDEDEDSGDPAPGEDSDGADGGADADAGDAGGEGSAAPAGDPALEAEVDDLMAELGETLAGLEA